MLNTVMVEGLVHDVRSAGRYTEVILANVGKTTQYFPVYTRERLDKSLISKRVRVCGVLDTITGLWRGLEEKKIAVIADFMNVLEER